MSAFAAFCCNSPLGQAVLSNSQLLLKVGTRALPLVQNCLSVHAKDLGLLDGKLGHPDLCQHGWQQPFAVTSAIKATLRNVQRGAAPAGRQSGTVLGTSMALLSASVKRGFLTPTGVLAAAVSHVLVWEMDLQCRRGKGHFTIKKKEGNYIRIQPWVNSRAMFPSAPCHGTGNHVTASSGDGSELNSGPSAWKSLWGKVLLSFKCSVGKGGGVRLGSKLLLCLAASINGAANFPVSL